MVSRSTNAPINKATGPAANITDHATEPHVWTCRCGLRHTVAITYCVLCGAKLCAVCHGTGKDPRFSFTVPCPACQPAAREEWSARLLHRGPHR